MITFYSEFNEDLWLEQHGMIPDKGVYVDVGCYHPQIASNTGRLRDKGWTGLAIDANPSLEGAWKKCGAKFVCAAVGDGTPVKYKVDFDQPAWSRCGAGIETPTQTLESLLEQHGIEQIDLLSIDLEGMEYDALLTMDLDKHAPRIIVAEYDTGGIGKDFRVLEHLLRGNYVALHMTAANIIYRRANKEGKK